MRTNVLEANWTAPLSEERINYLVEECKIAPEIAVIDLEKVKKKLQDPNEGKGWTPEYCDLVEVEYKRFLHLCKKYGKGMVPWGDVDTMWHFHILDTKAYHEDCQKAFGKYLHHFPYLGMRSKDDKQNLLNAGKRTKELYEKEFGETMGSKFEDPCWHWCQDECWHACQGD